MGQFIVDSKRAATMRLKLGKDASALIADDRWLPMFRNRQKQYNKLFALSIRIAKTKRQAGRYLAKMWSKANLTKTIDILNRLAEKLGRTVVNIHNAISDEVQPSINNSGIRCYQELKAQFNL